jgi:hypothetical protein
LDDPEYKIYRPRQIYTGEYKRNFEQPEAVNSPPALTASYVKSDPQAAMRRDTAEISLVEINELIEKAQKAVEELSVEDAISSETVDGESSMNGGVGGVGVKPPSRSGSLSTVDPSRFEIGPVSSWVVKKLFSNQGIGGPEAGIAAGTSGSAEAARAAVSNVCILHIPELEGSFNLRAVMF